MKTKFLRIILSLGATSILLFSMINTVEASPGSAVDPTITSIQPTTTE